MLLSPPPLCRWFAKPFCLLFILFAVLAPQAARADTYSTFVNHSIPGGRTFCIDNNTDQLVDMSFCQSNTSNTTAGKTEGNFNAVNSAGVALAGASISSTGSAVQNSASGGDQPSYWCSAGSDSFGSSNYCSSTSARAAYQCQSAKDADSVTKLQCSSPTPSQPSATDLVDKYDYDDVSASTPNLSIQSVGIGGNYNRTVFSDSASGNGSARITQSAGATFAYTQDFGRWGFSASVPIMQSFSNDPYTAFDNTSVGVAVVPMYHAFLEQIHGFGLDIGAVIGFQYVGYGNTEQLKSTPYNYTSVDNNTGGQFGILARGSKTVLPGTVLSLGANFVENHNLTNRDYFGGDTSLSTVDLGVVYSFGPILSLNGDLKSINVFPSGGSNLNYGEADVGVRANIAPRSSLQLQTSQSFGNGDWSATGVTLNFVWWLN